MYCTISISSNAKINFFLKFFLLSYKGAIYDRLLLKTRLLPKDVDFSGF